jgi:hypothetical protein
MSSKEAFCNKQISEMKIVMAFCSTKTIWTVVVISLSWLHVLSSYNLSCKTPLYSSSESDFRFVWTFVLSLLWSLSYYTCIMYLLLLVHLILIIPWTINIYVSLYSPCLVVSLQIIQHKHGVLYPYYITSWYSVKNPWIKVSS